MQFCVPPGSHSTVAALNGPHHCKIMSIYISITKEVTAVRSEGLIFEIKITSLLVSLDFLILFYVVTT